MIFYLVIFFFSICTASGVESLIINGNEHTQSHIIKREIHHPIPGEFDSTLAAQDRGRIYNLGLFSTVEINQINSSYTVFVIETFQLLPIPIVEYEEGKGLSYGGGIAYLNFRGLNEQLSVGGIGGKETTYFFNFIDPWVFGDHGEITTKIYQFYSESAVYNYSYKERAFLIGSGFYKGESHKFKSEVGYEIISLATTSTKSWESLKTLEIECFSIHSRRFIYTGRTY